MRASRSTIGVPAAVLVAALTVLLTWPRPAWAVCKGTRPNCGPCLYATCDPVDHPAWYCEFWAPGTPGDDDNECTANEHCNGAGACSGRPFVKCSMNNYLTASSSPLEVTNTMD